MGQADWLADKNRRTRRDPTAVAPEKQCQVRAERKSAGTLMSMLAPILFLGAAVFAVALAWYSIGDARLAAIDTVKQAFGPRGAQEITVTLSRRSNFVRYALVRSGRPGFRASQHSPEPLTGAEDAFASPPCIFAPAPCRLIEKLCRNMRQLRTSAAAASHLLLTRMEQTVNKGFIEH